MATRLDLLLILCATSIVFLSVRSEPSAAASSYIHYKLTENHHYRSSLVTFLHRQPDGSQLATIRYYRIVFHCHILPGALYLRFSQSSPYRTVVQNRNDPSTIFAFRSVGAYSRVQIQSYRSGSWLCMNRRGRIVQRSNISVNNLACTFRQTSDGLYMTLISELDPSRTMSFDTVYLLSMNSHLRRRYAHSLMQIKANSSPDERCQRFMFDSDIDRTLLDRTR